MATLTRPATSRAEDSSAQALDSILTSSVPTPFPRELLQAPEIVATMEAGPSRVIEVPPAVVQQELLPSIAFVEKTCLMTLNTLLSGPTRWTPIVPDRRHSMPSSPTASAAPQAEFQSSSALQTLVSNLRSQDSEMVELQGSSDTALLNELRSRVDQMAPSLEPADAHLAESIVSLLTHFNQLSTLYSTDNTSRSMALHEEPLLPPRDLFNTLKRQLSDLQIERQTSQHEPLPPNTPPVIAVEKTLLWSKIDEELDNVLALCKEHAERLDHLPPQYDYDDLEHPPQYDLQSPRASLEEPKGKATLQSPTLATTNEKMRLDLEAVTMAIDRLYLVAPQLHNQRVELKSSKVAQMEKARKEGASSVARGKQKENDTRDLERMLELIGKASERTLKDQSVILEGGMKSRLERARQRDVAKREAFVEHLAGYSDARRFHQQDAILQPHRTKSPEAMLTLPEFIREPIPDSVRLQDPNAMLTLPEFVKEMPPPHVVERSSPPTPPSATRIKSRRSRSLSSPSLSWLRSSSSRSTLKSEMSNSASIESVLETDTKFSVTYVAEHHENLHHILVFLTIHGATPGVDIEAEVLPSGGGDSESGGDYLVIKSGAHTSLPLVLPGRTAPGKQPVRVQGSHFEIKLSTLSSSNSSSPDLSYSAPLLDATQLNTSAPSTFICASCSLPLVQSAAAVQTYQDLPSEHWEELVDAWMCHSDQKLNERVMKQGKGGFWPGRGQALVGGSYILFEEQAMTRQNLSPAEETKRGEDWRLVRCLCGAVVGRCQEHEASGEMQNVFRMLKYAIRPVSSATEPSRLPLSAFIVEDMAEFVEAHASYRFIILDEEEEKARILIWLFKPNMRMAYTTQTQYALPRSASIRTAKVLYKLLGPSEVVTDLKSILNTYPGFPQAEYLFYPMDICRQLAAVLKESNRSYPESMRVMTGLEVARAGLDLLLFAPSSHSLISPLCIALIHINLDPPFVPQSFMSERRQSTRISAARARDTSSSKNVPNAQASVSDDDDGFEGFSEEDSDKDSESEADYGPPSAKRQKTAKSAAVAKRGPTTKGRRQKNCPLVELPLDVLFEIFGRCPPEDLISFSRTSHTLRAHLLSEASGGIWRAAREHADGPPVCPGMSEQQWAHLLYGKPVCQSCGARNIQRVDWGLQRRICVACRKGNLVVKSRFKTSYPDVDLSILDLLLYTHIGGHSHGHASSSFFYWQADITAMVQKMQALDKDIQLRVPGARKRKEAFIAERKAFIESIAEHAEVCLSWLDGAKDRRQKEKQLVQKKRFDDIKAKLMALGYEEKDMQVIRWQTSVQQATPLTERGWKILRPSLETDVRDAKEKRLKAEQQQLLAKRRKIVVQLYEDHKRTLVPNQWRTLPKLFELCEDAMFQSVINCPADVEVTAAHFNDAIQALPQTIIALQTARTANLQALIDSKPLSIQVTEPEPGEIAPHPRSLNSALAVFVCEKRCSTWNTSEVTYIGEEAAAAHECKHSQYYNEAPPAETVFKLSQRGVLAASSLVKLSGLDVTNATCAQMDRLDARYICLGCPRRRSAQGEHHNAYSWRAAVTHFALKGCNPNLVAPQMQLMDSAQTDAVKRTEGADTTLSWTCNHCAAHLKNCDTRANVVEHCKTSHAIVDPVVPRDLFRLLDLQRPAASFLIPVEQSQYHCMLCSTPSQKTRLFIFEGVRSHIKAKFVLSLYEVNLLMRSCFSDIKYQNLRRTSIGGRLADSQKL
ncbi:hypothetical protein MIND_00169900 [Mycena indigotica]|uniref:F-box domain-containing protein n=1 Tax=Mycena indigotica TaxID=2126181 RepID=A0A8H6TGV0_9AGAR|nr:uncharacterized protein MIND_00169900 [Mycena indigotica]KAF7316507.1 hypothetical protein MIND_00169900 [Mycena indigotica]